MAKQEDLFKNVISHAKEYGFIFPSSEIYDGLSAVYDYAQDGAELKKNIREYWWKAMVQMHDNIVGIDAAIFMHEDITGAAKSIADNTMTQEKEADEFAKLSVKHQYDVMMEGIKQTNRIALETQKASLKNTESNPFGTNTDGKGGKGNKLANTTVAAYLNENYKGAKIKGHWGDEIKSLETKLANNSS